MKSKLKPKNTKTTAGSVHVPAVLPADKEGGSEPAIVYKQKLTIIIPVYNEEKFIAEIYSRVMAVNLHPDIVKEVIIIDDHSKDETKKINWINAIIFSKVT